MPHLHFYVNASHGINMVSKSHVDELESSGSESEGISDEGISEHYEDGTESEDDGEKI